MNELVHPQPVAAATALADFAAGLAYDDIPPSVVARARDCLLDAVACALFGARFPWSERIRHLTTLVPAAGFLPLWQGDGPGGVRDAALVWGSHAHAFELDSLSKPSAGVHPGATVALPALALARARGASGRDLLAAIVAGCEVMIRIGRATLHTPEKRGFHAPGITGPFGSAVAAARLMDLDAPRLAHALGIAASLGSGLLAFSKSTKGGMVKRLHLGRAAEAGVLAAQLAAEDYEGPETALDGKFGVLEAFCNETDPAQLTEGLGKSWRTEAICLKQFACHVTAHPPVQLLRSLLDRHRLAGEDIAALRVGVSDKVLSHHTARAPADIMQAQYSVPYCTAIAAYRDPANPRVFSDDVLADERIRRLAAAIEIEPRRDSSLTGWAVEMTLTPRNAAPISASLDDFIGCPTTPLSAERLHAKWTTLTRDLAGEPERLYARLASLETIADIRSLAAS